MVGGDKETNFKKTVKAKKTKAKRAGTEGGCTRTLLCAQDCTAGTNTVTEDSLGIAVDKTTDADDDANAAKTVPKENMVNRAKQLAAAMTAAKVMKGEKGDGEKNNDAINAERLRTKPANNNKGVPAGKKTATQRTKNAGGR